MIDPSFVTKEEHWSSATISIFDFSLLLVAIWANSALQFHPILAARSV
jgi:hypothetical protein